MSETNTAAPAAAPASAPAAEPAATNPATPAPAAGEANLDPVALQGKLEKAVAESKNLRERLKAAEAAEAKLKELEQKDMSELERLKAQLAEKEQLAAEAVTRARALQIRSVAAAAGCEPEAAALWLGTQQLSEFSDEAITAALASAPAWVKAQAAPGVSTPAHNPARPGAPLSVEAINKMTPEEYAALPEAELARVWGSQR